MGDVFVITKVINENQEETWFQIVGVFTDEKAANKFLDDYKKMIIDNEGWTYNHFPSKYEFHIEGHKLNQLSEGVEI